MSFPPDFPLDIYLSKAVFIAKECGQVIRTAFEHRHSSNSLTDPSLTLLKENNDANLVTVTDKQVEKLCFEYLKKEFPHHKFIGEESCSDNDNKITLTDDPTWIVDPIDGTSNFVHGFPFCCISIGLVISKVPSVGVVFNPIMNELYTAYKGGGAFLNGISLIKPFTVPLNGLSKSIIAIEFGNDREKVIMDPKLRTLEKIIMNPTRAFRAGGSAALNCCFVAKGVFDGYFEFGVYPWDIAAGEIILRESGALIANVSPCLNLNEFDVTARNILTVRGGSDQSSAVSMINKLNELIEPVLEYST